MLIIDPEVFACANVTIADTLFTDTLFCLIVHQ